jgi:hypothetical protein
MRARFVPSYHARDLLHKLQQLRQGTKSVEEYYQELQMGMLRCGLEENEDAAMARFMGGLNREIQDILAYKEYNSVTRLFHLACNAEREVQGRRASMRTNIPAGRASSWTPSIAAATSTRAAAPSSSSKPRPSTTNSAPCPTEPTRGQQPHLLRVRPQWHHRDAQGTFSAYAARAMFMWQGLPKHTCSGRANGWWVFLY